MKKTISDAFKPYIGTIEYNGIVAKIQRWFYGDLVKASWCATSVSYFANEVGVLDQLGGKNENVYQMMMAAKKQWENTGIGNFKFRADIPIGYVIKAGTVLFLLKSSPPMTTTSSKHVTTAVEDFLFNGSGYCKCLGGNQSDSIRISQYSQKTIYAIFEPDYGDEPKKHTTLRKGDKGPEVKEMQNDLRELGFAMVSGKEMVADGSFGAITKATVVAFQVSTGLKADAVCGPKTWAKIDELLEMEPTETVALTDVYYRIGPGPGYKTLGIVKEGDKVVFTDIVNENWMYIPELKGWSKTSYYNLGPVIDYAE